MVLYSSFYYKSIENTGFNVFVCIVNKLKITFVLTLIAFEFIILN